MPFNINDFISRGLIYGGARPSLFDVEVNFPVELRNMPASGVTIAEKLRFTCRGTSLPASTVASIDVPYFSRFVKVHGDRVFDNWNVTIMNDEDYVVRNAIESWHNNINSIVSNRRLTSPQGYRGNAIVRHYSRDGSPKFIKAYEFVNIFPIQVGEMTMDWEATNQIQVFPAVFAFDYYLPLNGDGNDLDPNL